MTGDAEELNMLRAREVAALLKIANSTLWAWVAQGHFPEPVHLGLGRRLARWPMSDVDRFVSQKMAARGGQPAPAA